MSLFCRDLVGGVGANMKVVFESWNRVRMRKLFDIRLCVLEAP